MKRHLKKIPALAMIGGLALAGVACEAENGDVGDPGVVDPNAPEDGGLGGTDTGGDDLGG